VVGDLAGLRDMDMSIVLLILFAITTAERAAYCWRLAYDCKGRERVLAELG
jgi:hypothetical protein